MEEVTGDGFGPRGFGQDLGVTSPYRSIRRHRTALASRLHHAGLGSAERFLRPNNFIALQANVAQGVSETDIEIEEEATHSRSVSSLEQAVCDNNAADHFAT